MRNISTENQKIRELLTTLKVLSPGTPLREGIDYISQGKTGGLIVVGDTPEILDLTEGGFRINCQYTPARLYELSKMDGAIILSEDRKRIVRANVTLRVNPSIPSTETGLRHRSADKFAKQIEHIVLAVSQSRNTLTLYFKNQIHEFKSLDKIYTAGIDELEAVEGVGKARASTIKDTLAQMKTKTAQPHLLALPVFD